MNRFDSLFKDNNRDNNSDNKIISILSGKGGVGKSVISYNLAHSLSKLNQRVLLIDADLNSGNLHLLSNTHTEIGIDSLLNGLTTVSETITEIEQSFDLLASINSSLVIDGNNNDYIKNFVKNLVSISPDYDKVIIDHASGVSNFSTAIAYASDLNLITLVPEITSIADAYGLFKHLHTTGDNLKCQLLINRVEFEEEAEDIGEKFNELTGKFLKSSIRTIGSISEDQLIRKSVAAQKPLSEIDNESIALHGLMEAVERLNGNLIDLLSGSNQEEINKLTAHADIRG